MATSPVAQEPPVFAATLESVYLDVFVTRDGEPVRGLTTEDFEVLDGGRPVPIEMVPTEAVPLSALLVLDTSLSTSGAKLDSGGRAAERLPADKIRGEAVARQVCTSCHAFPPPESCRATSGARRSSR